MKRILKLLLIICLLYSCCYAQDVVSDVDNNRVVEVYNEKDKYGLKCGEEYITKPIYRKIIRLGDSSWVIQHNYKFGIISNTGEILVKPKYKSVDRLDKKYAKLGNYNDFGVYNEYGVLVLKHEYSAIEMLNKNVFLTCKNYKYGLADIEGNIILDNIFDSISMPEKRVLSVEYGGKKQTFRYDVSGIENVDFNLVKEQISNEFNLTDLVVNTGVVSTYSVVTATDYVLKIFSSLSRAYESTIDELMYSKGADSVEMLKKSTWIPMFPFVYARNYFRQVKTPNNSPLSTTRNTIINKYR